MRLVHSAAKPTRGFWFYQTNLISVGASGAKGQDWRLDDLKYAYQVSLADRGQNRGPEQHESHSHLPRAEMPIRSMRYSTANERTGSTGPRSPERYDAVIISPYQPTLNLNLKLSVVLRMGLRERSCLDMPTS